MAQVPPLLGFGGAGRHARGGPTPAPAPAKLPPPLPPTAPHPSVALSAVPELGRRIPRAESMQCFVLTSWLLGLVVCFSLRVREVLGSIPGAAL